MFMGSMLGKVRGHWRQRVAGDFVPLSKPENRFRILEGTETDPSATGQEPWAATEVLIRPV